MGRRLSLFRQGDIGLASAAPPRDSFRRFGTGPTLDGGFGLDLTVTLRLFHPDRVWREK